MKKNLSAIICVLLCMLVFCSCANTEVFGAGGFSMFVKLGDYKNLTVDKNSEEFKNSFNIAHLTNIAAADCFVKSEEGEVQFGDKANIDFEGKIDGTPFNGGTDSGYDLVIGSGKFIEGFEDGLIGVAVGETVDLNLKFPDEYDNVDVAGKDCIFTVTVNYRNVPKTPEESYEELGYKSLKEYTDSVEEGCIENLMISEFIKSCKFKKNPDIRKFKAVVVTNYYNEICTQNYSQTLAEYLESNNSNINNFISGMINNLSDNAFDTHADMRYIKNALLGFYAVYHKEGLSYDKKELGDATEYEKYFKESVIIKEKVLKILRENLTVKE